MERTNPETDQRKRCCAISTYDGCCARYCTRDTFKNGRCRDHQSFNEDTTFTCTSQIRPGEKITLKAKELGWIEPKSTPL